MVAKMMRWRPWPPLLPSAKFQVRLLVASLRGFRPKDPNSGPLLVQVRWKGPRAAWLRRSVRRNCTREVSVVAGDEERPGLDPAVEWNEEFQSECTLTATRDGGFHPWEIFFNVVNGLNNGTKNKFTMIGTASLNLADFVSEAKEKEIKLSIPLSLASGNLEPPLFLHLTLSILDLGVPQSSSEITHGTIVSTPSSPVNGVVHTEKDEVSSLMRKVKIFTDIVSTRKSKKTCQEDEGSEGRLSARSDDAAYTFDTDSADDDFNDVKVEDRKNNFSIRKSFSYGTLAVANILGGSFYSQTRTGNDYEDWVFYSRQRSDVVSSPSDAIPGLSEQQPALQTAKRSIIPWGKRKLNFKNPKDKGLPLLNKDYGEEGGDDIDFDRRQMSSSAESPSRQIGDGESMGPSSSDSHFGDDNFVVGSWETKEVVSRDGHMKIFTQLFFASIDQRSERAAGESACTVLVAIIADWFQNNNGIMPNQSQFDGLIRDGSSEWRDLCKNDVYRERFPDKHFDLDTVLEAGVRPLSVVPSKSFVGFFHPEVISDDNSTFSFLHGAMSFDSIWDEISQNRIANLEDGYSDLYIVSWNDHLFVLVVEPKAYYIIDTLGERLHEGCDRAYILKFDNNSIIRRMPLETKAGDGESKDQQKQQSCIQKDQMVEGIASKDYEENVICHGEESCREYIKNFLAAIPIRELQADIKKGKVGPTSIHQRLQIEFHYARPLQQNL